MKKWKLTIDKTNDGFVVVKKLPPTFRTWNKEVKMETTYKHEEIEKVIEDIVDAVKYDMSYRM